MNEILSICIPTYNRAECLKVGIEELIFCIEKYNIPIYISDNNSEDNTESVVSELKKKYEHIYYFKNEKNIGVDRNFEKVLKLSKSKYSWLLGDDDRIDCDYMDEVMAILNDEHDLIVVNGVTLKKVRINNINSKLYKEHNALLTELGWHMTWISCLIFSKKLINDAKFDKYYGSYLIQFAIVFDYLGKKEAVDVFWNQNCIISVDVSTKRDLSTSWTPKAFLIFAKNWCDLIDSFSNKYSIESKNRCILLHGDKSGFFRLKNIIVLRHLKIYNIKVLLKYKSYISRTIKYPYFILWLIAILPDRFYDILKIIYKLFKK